MSSKLEIGLIAAGAGAALAGCYLLRKWRASGRRNEDVPIQTVPVPVVESRVEEVLLDSGPTEGPVEENVSVVTKTNGGKKKETKPIYRALKKYNLDVIINGHKLVMVIDSGSQNTIINISEWIKLGKPKLEHAAEMYGAIGAIRVKGKFTAAIQLGGRLFKLPVVVSGLSDTTNLLGRRWFPSLHLDWNSIFHCQSNGINLFQKRCEQQDKLALKMKKHYSKKFTIDLQLEGVCIRMMLDTGAMRTLIGQKCWEDLGKPPLKTTKTVLVDAAKERLPLEGECLVDVEYQGKKMVLPLLVMSGVTNNKIILGTNWFKYLQLDFNTIFRDLRVGK